MKTLICILSAIVVFSFVAVPVRADTTNDTEFASRLVEVFKDCQKVKPGMTRAELTALQMFDEDRGPLHARDDHSFNQHMTYRYRSCWLIKIDVDFAASDSKDERPTDIIAKVSMPCIDARARR